MAQLLTRAEFRDAIRRDLQIVPPIDTGLPGTLLGQQPTDDPNPTNTQINQALDQATADINRVAGYHINTFSVTLPAQTATGPYGVSLSSLSAGGALLPGGTITDIRRVLWTDSQGGVPVLLQPTNRNFLDRGDISTYYSTAASFPSMWWIEGYSLFISPSPSDSGVLTLTCGTGVIGFSTDSSTLDQIPVEYQWVIEYQAIVRLSKSSTMDIEAKERAAMYGQDAAAGMMQFKSWIEGQSGVVQPFLSFGGNYRGGYGTRRTIR